MADLDQGTIEEVTKGIIRAAKKATSELDLQTDVTHILKNFFARLGIDYDAHHNITVIRGRPDTLYGRVVIEYKVPGTLGSKSKLNAAIEEVQKNIQELSTKYGEDASKYVGIVLDGFQITFTKYRGNGWTTEPVTEVRSETVTRMLEYLRGLARKPLHPDLMVRDFGPDSELARTAVQVLYQQLKSKIPRVGVLYEEWKKIFNQVCGYDFLSPKLDVKELVDAYEIPSKQIELTKLLFSIHTYYALVIKFLAAEITVTYASPFFRSFLDELLNLQSGSLKRKLALLEEGGVFSELGIKNFLEGDFFGWYLDSWNEDIQKIVILTARKLSEYEPATVTLEPDEVRDLLKKLYQYLVPPKIRHDLGEFFTPDWLAELTLNEIGYDGNPEKRLLDPACGSGTFLVLVIKRISEYAENKALDKGHTLSSLLANVVGFDLNPLAVIASRTNYLIALGELIRHRQGDIFIPVYLSDSISVANPSQETLEGPIFEMVTSVGKFVIPAAVVQEKLIDKIFSLADECVRNKYHPKEFIDRLRSSFDNADDRSIELLKKVYSDLLNLEKRGINRIWARLIKNAFAPVFSGKFDYVVGNPPWINWEYLPEDYRDTTKHLWDNYGLLQKTKGMGMGKIKRDIAMLFVARSVDQYLSSEGKLAFLIPYTVYKTQAGAGFRNWLATKTQVEKIHDLVELYPFEGAVNRTSLLVLRNGNQTKFPITCQMWSNPTYKGIDMGESLKNVIKQTRQYKMIFTPIRKGRAETPWMMITPKAQRAIVSITGESPHYRAYAGIYTDLNGVFWIDILSKEARGLLITPTKAAGQKKQVEEITTVIEPDLVYPLIRGRDVKRWFIESYSNYILLPVDSNGDTLDHSKMKTKYPKSYQYFLNFVDDLTARGGEPYNSKLKPYRSRTFAKAEKEAPPFYWLFNAAPSLSPYKVIWKRIAGGITGKAVSFASAVLAPTKDAILEEAKPIVLNDSLILVPFDSAEEAYYVSGMLNSSPIRFTIASYTYELRMETHITQYIRIPQFDPSDKDHIEISQLSKKAHIFAKRYYQDNDASAYDELKKIENQIDEHVAKVYEINRDELEEIEYTLGILGGNETSG